MFRNNEAGYVVNILIAAIQKNRDYLSEIDGKIGDGDHGVNMSKGFTMCEARLRELGAYSLGKGLSILSGTLMEGIGGSMGPLYGMFFAGLADIAEAHAEIDENIFSQMLDRALEGVEDIGNARLGDKTLLDTLIPACEAFKTSLKNGQSFDDCLDSMVAAAEEGWRATEGMVARVGRASRLGERSRGVLDAGATSCFIILSSLASSIKALNHK